MKFKASYKRFLLILALVASFNLEEVRKRREFISAEPLLKLP